MIFGGKALAISSMVLAGWFGSDDGATKDEFDDCTIENNTLSSGHDSFKAVWNMCIDKHQKDVVLEKQDTLIVKGHPESFVNGLGVEDYVFEVSIKNKSHEKFITSFKAVFGVPNGKGFTKTFDHLMILEEGKKIKIPIDHTSYMEMSTFLKQHHQENNDRAEVTLKAIVSEIKGLDTDD